MEIIIYLNDDGGVSIISPSLDCGLSIQEIAEKDVPDQQNGAKSQYFIIDDADLPDRELRDRWAIEDGKVIAKDLVEA